MAGRVKIAPSILAADFARLGAEVAEAEAAGADYIHVDVMDGHFVPNLTMGPPIVRAVRRVTELPLDVHLMMEAPERYLADFAEAGANILTVHVETCPHLHRTVEQIKELGCRAGVTLNPATPAASLQEILRFADLVLVMTVNPGFGGQRYIEGIEDKIGQVRAMLDDGGLHAELEVDGGIDAETAGRVVRAGADVLVAGTAIFGAEEGVRSAIERIRNAF
ncbi:MAG: ribulose-phosphate 3-epimerase [Anaerolineaceae bacterium]|nr:ribulose-phosphate 3-epimerase [Anaerolineae bacterium]MDX9829185.1 ribulose-phosphate 3-epimerase [Anaerolineae bacterium]NLF13991.1 ribulose-phosphate 3-epimerase [Anaerolineaceae bacterium]